MDLHNCFRAALFAVASALLPSCASVSVTNLSNADTKVSRPSRIDVIPFQVNQSAVRENPARKNPGQLSADARQLLDSYLVAELNQLGLHSQLVQNPKPAGDAWIVSGTITRVEEGSRMLRMAMGLGMGGTKFETHVTVSTASNPKPILDFHTTGGSNATPGAVTTPIPFSSVPTALLNSKEGVTDDAARTARMIAATIGSYMADHGWLDAKSVPRPKLQSSTR